MWVVKCGITLVCEVCLRVDYKTCLQDNNEGSASWGDNNSFIHGADSAASQGGCIQLQRDALQAKATRSFELLVSDGACFEAPGKPYKANALHTTLAGTTRSSSLLNVASARGYEKVTELPVSNGADVNAQGGFLKQRIGARLRDGHQAGKQCADINT